MAATAVARAAATEVETRAATVASYGKAGAALDIGDTGRETREAAKVATSRVVGGPSTGVDSRGMPLGPSDRERSRSSRSDSSAAGSSSGAGASAAGWAAGGRKPSPAAESERQRSSGAAASAGATLGFGSVSQPTSSRPASAGRTAHASNAAVSGREAKSHNPKAKGIGGAAAASQAGGRVSSPPLSAAVAAHVPPRVSVSIPLIPRVAGLVPSAGSRRGKFMADIRPRTDARRGTTVHRPSHITVDTTAGDVTSHGDTSGHGHGVPSKRSPTTRLDTESSGDASAHPAGSQARHAARLLRDCNGRSQGGGTPVATA